MTTKTMTAAEKRTEIEEEWNSTSRKFLHRCSGAIRNATSLRMSVMVPYKTPEAAVARVVKELENLGWICKRDKGFDQRDGDSWDNLVISAE